jgi:hypothetical protein
MPLVDKQRPADVCAAVKGVPYPPQEFGVLVPPSGEGLVKAALAGQPVAGEHHEDTDGPAEHGPALREHAFVTGWVTRRRPGIQIGRARSRGAPEGRGGPQFNCGPAQQARVQDHVGVKLDDVADRGQGAQGLPKRGVESQALVPRSLVVDSQI